MSRKPLKYLLTTLLSAGVFWACSVTTKPVGDHVHDADCDHDHVPEAPVVPRDVRAVMQDAAAMGTLPDVAAAIAAIGDTTLAEIPRPDSILSLRDSALSLRDSLLPNDSTALAHAPAVFDSLAARRALLRRISAMVAPYNHVAQEMRDSLFAEGAPMAEVWDQGLEQLMPLVDSLAGLGVELPQEGDSLVAEGDLLARLNAMLAQHAPLVTPDSTEIAAAVRPDSLPAPRPRREPRPFLDEPMSFQGKDSLVYDVRNNRVYVYREGNIDYGKMNLKADFMRLSTDTKEIRAYGVMPDDTTATKATRPAFTEGGTTYEMDTITYNINSKKAKIKGVTTQEGEGWLIGQEVKMHHDQTVSISGGMYTTCDHTDHPHFYLAMNRAKLIPGKKVIVGRSWFVMEDVPIVFPFLPFGFFPMTTGRQSGFIMPSWGEEYSKGFFLRNGGYYFAFNDYLDLQLTGSIYTLGSWDAAASSRYLKRYKYSGSINVRYSQDIIGEKGDGANYYNSSNYSIQWSHRQDPKFKPNTNFSASVNFSSSGYNKYSTQSVNESVQTQTNSSISYSKSWAGKPFSFAASFRHSQNSKTEQMTFNFPDITFNVSRIYPFKRSLDKRVGKERWYEKISFTYSGKAQGTVTANEKEIFTEQTLRNMRTGVSHSVPVSVSWSLFDYINFTPSASYNERWYFQRINQEWDPVANEVKKDTTYGFHRVWDYSVSASMNTTVYGMFRFGGEKPLISAIRHVITPSVSISFRPDFSDPKYGYYESVQTSADGTVSTYSPYQNGMYGLPGSGRSASLSFSLKQNLEIKVRSERDTTGTRKIKLIDDLTLSGSYNMLADSMNLSTISFSFRTPITQRQTLSINGSLDPYQVDANGRRIGKYLVKSGKLVRVSRASTSFSHTFGPKSNSARPVDNQTADNMGAPPMPEDNFFADQEVANDIYRQRELLANQYYDFNVPWSLSLSYSLTYTNTGIKSNLDHQFSFNGNISPTDKWAITFGGTFDFKTNRLLPSQISIRRDLHCWEMSLNWVPVGYLKSWSFKINVKASTLKDLKYDKSSGRYDTLYDR
ncbi:LPS-assembly protein LptD [Alistipes sp. OttesenSCG-928-B03]|nr:LPS-assembly protein LptD [Alistipes sp. OttesenSCG-928-B03]